MHEVPQYANKGKSQLFESEYQPITVMKGRESNDNWHKALFQAAMRAHFTNQIKKYKEMAEIEACPYVRDDPENNA